MVFMGTVDACSCFRKKRIENLEKFGMEAANKIPLSISEPRAFPELW